MFKFFNEKGVEVFSSSELSEVEKEALEYKKQNNLPALAICRQNNSFYKWI